RLANRSDDFFWQDGTVLFEHSQTGIMNVPIELNARCLKHTAGRFSNFWSGSVTRNQRDSVRHVSSVKCPLTCVIGMQNSCSGGQRQLLHPRGPSMIIARMSAAAAQSGKQTCELCYILWR